MIPASYPARGYHRDGTPKQGAEGSVRYGNRLKSTVRPAGNLHGCDADLVLHLEHLENPDLEVPPWRSRRLTRICLEMGVRSAEVQRFGGSPAVFARPTPHVLHRRGRAGFTQVALPQAVVIVEHHGYQTPNRISRSLADAGKTRLATWNFTCTCLSCSWGTKKIDESSRKCHSVAAVLYSYTVAPAVQHQLTVLGLAW
jgi:hypothetical protein